MKNKGSDGDKDLSYEIDKQILQEQRDVKFETKEYTIELFVNKYSKGLDSDENELFIPDYQRDDVWDNKRKSKLIESLLMGLPIPYIFTSDSENEDEFLDGRLEIIDGSQRLRTLHQFIENKLRLSHLETLDKLNGNTFSDLLRSRQRRFLRHPLRVIELTSAKEDTRRELFERINTGSEILNIMEVRRGSNIGDTYFYKKVISKCAKNPLFIRLTPMTSAREKRFEREEMVSRFFSYLNKYQEFKHLVHEFVTNYLDSQKDIGEEEINKNIKELNMTLSFIEKHFPFGFRKSNTSNSIPRVRFESIAVGTALALRENPSLLPNTKDIEKWITSKEFTKLTTSDGSNSLNRVKKRIEFVKDKLLACMV